MYIYIYIYIHIVRHLVKKNCGDHSRDPAAYPEALDDEFPEFSKFWFCWCPGKKVINVDTTTLSQAADLKNVDQLDSAKLFMWAIRRSIASYTCF